MVIIVGCGRSGTKYVAECLKKAGYDFQHEHIGRDGGIGWPLALPEFYPQKGAIYLHQIREPLKTVSTLVSHTKNVWEPVRQVIPNLPTLEFDHKNKLTREERHADSQYRRAMFYWYHYNVYCSGLAMLSYDVADLHPGGTAAIALAYLGLKGKWGAVPATFNHRNHPPVSWEKLREVDKEMADKVEGAWERYKAQRPKHFHSVA